MTKEVSTEFERGARAAVEAFDLYLRNEDEVICAGMFYEDGTWQRFSESTIDSFKRGAVSDALNDERAGLHVQEVGRG